MTRRFHQTALAGASLLFVLACGTSPGSLAAMPGAAESGAMVQSSGREPVIDHIAPRRDSTGPRPATFEWTGVPGADQYAIGMWNEVDRMMWSQSGITKTTVELPKELVLDFGTYFWSVTALRDGHPIADSGLAAFVITE